MRSASTVACLFLLVALAGCEAAPPAAPVAADRDAPAPAREPAQPGQLQDAIDARDHRDKAAHAGDAVEAADKAKEQALEDAGG